MRISLRRVVGVLCDFLPLPIEERRVVPFFQFQTSKGGFMSLYSTEADAWLMPGEAKRWAWLEMTLMSEQGKRTTEWMRWIVLTAGQGPCPPWDINQLEGSNPGTSCHYREASWNVSKDQGLEHGSNCITHSCGWYSKEAPGRGSLRNPWKYSMKERATTLASATYRDLKLDYNTMYGRPCSFLQIFCFSLYVTQEKA